MPKFSYEKPVPFVCVNCHEKIIGIRDVNGRTKVKCPQAPYSHGRVRPTGTNNYAVTKEKLQFISLYDIYGKTLGRSETEAL